MPDPVTNIAFDYSSVRSYDHDGRLRVELTNISKANVCPYYGSEIPLEGLDQQKVYYLLRAPEELRMAADTSNSIQLLLTHEITTPDQPRKYSTVGATGSDAQFVDPYLRNSLVVWDQEAIDLIESGKQKQLSCAYHYDADMTTPGIYMGQKYDGVMRNLKFNHVAMVEVGRAGKDVVVQDSMPLDIILTGDIQNMTKQNLATDAKDCPGEDEDDDKEKAMKAKDKKASDDMEDMDDVAGDEDDDKDEDKPKAKDKKAGKDKAKDKAKDEDDDDEDDDKKPAKDSKPAMDAMIEAAVEARVNSTIDQVIKATEKRMKDNQRALREAEEIVRPRLGNVAMDSAKEVYELLLKEEGVPVEGVHPSAYKALAQMAVKASTTSKQTSEIAFDHSAVATLASKYPNAARIAGRTIN